MLSSLYTVTMFAAAMAVLCALMETMIPQGKLKSTALLALGIVFLLSLAVPIVDLIMQEAPSIDTGLMQEAYDIGQSPTHEELLKGYFEQSMIKQK